MKPIKKGFGRKQVLPIKFSPKIRRKIETKSYSSEDSLIKTISNELIKKAKKRVKPKGNKEGNRIYSLTHSTKHNSNLATNSFKSNCSSDLSEGLNVVLDLMSPTKDVILISSQENSVIRHQMEKKETYYTKLEKYVSQNIKKFPTDEVREIKYLLQVQNIKIKENNPLLYQKKIKHSFRQKLLVWICDLCHEFNFERLTYYLAITLLDLFLSKTANWDSKKFQLLGLGALSISSKFYEVESNRLTIYWDKSNKSYSVNEIKRMEIDLLLKLDYNISFPNIYNILFYMIGMWDTYILSNYLEDRNKLNVLFIKVNPNEKMFYSLMHLLDLALLDTKYLNINPFKLSAALIYSVLLLFLENRKSNLLVNFLKNGISCHEVNIFLRLYVDYLGSYFLIKFRNLFKSFNYIGSFIDLYLSSSNRHYQLGNFTFRKLLQTPYMNKEKIHSFFENLDYKK